MAPASPAALRDRNIVEIMGLDNRLLRCFMSTGTVPSEQRFTAAEVEDPSSPSGIWVYVWHTLGFGGKSFPLVCSRPASFAARTGQALLEPERGYLQVYVDDPAAASEGTREFALREGSMLLLWWLVLGLDLAWNKGTFTDGSHDWIGVKYGMTDAGPTMELPVKYLEETVEALEPLCKASGTVALKKVQRALGKAGRIGYIVPDASPFVASLWAGFRAGRRSAEEGKPGTMKYRLPTRRFAVAAKWLSTLISQALRQEDRGRKALCRVMGNNRGKLNHKELPTISFDASPWGGGGFLWRKGRPVQFTHFIWSPSALNILRAEVGECKYQTLFEFYTLFLVAETFDDVLRETGAHIRGDNVSSLNDALTLKSTSPSMNLISKEIGWRRIVRGWQFSLSHLPAKQNDEADALSRLKAVPPRELPRSELKGAKFRAAPRQSVGLWMARISYD